MLDFIGSRLWGELITQIISNTLFRRRTRDYRLLQPLIPETVGIYKFIDDKGEIIYVGKAKSYSGAPPLYLPDSKNSFNDHDDGWWRRCSSLEYMVVETE